MLNPRGIVIKLYSDCATVCIAEGAVFETRHGKDFCLRRAVGPTEPLTHFVPEASRVKLAALSVMIMLLHDAVLSTVAACSRVCSAVMRRNRTVGCVRVRAWPYQPIFTKFVMNVITAGHSTDVLCNAVQSQRHGGRTNL